MKLFKLTKEGDNINDAYIVFVKRQKRKLGSGGFKVHLNRKLGEIGQFKEKIIKRINISYSKQSGFSINTTVYIDGYSEYRDPKTKMKGFLRIEDIAKQDAGICSWYKTELKEFTVEG